MNDLATIDLNTGELQQYKPEESVNNIRVAEAAEKYYRQAKNIEGLRKAIEAKWKERHDFVNWWDRQEKDQGGRPAETCDRPDAGYSKLDQFGLNSKVVSRWRQKCAEDDKLQIIIETQFSKVARIIDPDALVDKHTGDEESYTPPQYIESARSVIGEFDIDPASNDQAQETVKAKEYHTIDDSGLDYDWYGNVWLNPPYTKKIIDKFVEKLVGHYQDGDIQQAVLLVNNNTDTQWFLKAAKSSSAICFTTGRINFLKRDGSTSSPTNGQAFIYFGRDVEKFKSEFGQYGLVMVMA